MYLEAAYDEADLRRVEAENEQAFEEAARPYRMAGRAVVSLALGWLGISLSHDHPYLGPVPSAAGGFLSGATRATSDGVADFMGAFDSPACERYLAAVGMQAESAFLTARFADLVSLARGQRSFFQTGMRGEGTYHTAPAFILLTGLVCRNRDVQAAHREQLERVAGSESFYKRVSCCLDLAERNCLKASYADRIDNLRTCPMTACCMFMSEEVKLLNVAYGKGIAPEADYLSFRDHLVGALPALRERLAPKK